MSEVMLPVFLPFNALMKDESAILLANIGEYIGEYRRIYRVRIRVSAGLGHRRSYFLLSFHSFRRFGARVTLLGLYPSVCFSVSFLTFREKKNLKAGFPLFDSREGKKGREGRRKARGEEMEEEEEEGE